MAEPAQRTFAVAIMNCDSGMYFQRRITPAGPSLEELRARLADNGVISTDTPEDVRSTDTLAPVEQTKTTELSCNGCKKDEPEAEQTRTVTRNGISVVFSPAPCCPAAESVPCKACAADGWASTDEIDRFTWTISGGLTGDPEPATDEELEGFDPDDCSFREIPEADTTLTGDEGHEDDRPDDDDSSPRLSVAEWICREADRYAALGTAAADLIAETLHALARGFDRVGGSTVEQYKDRWAALDAPGI